MRSEKTRYLIMAIIASILAIVVLRYAYSQTQTVVDYKNGRVTPVMAQAVANRPLSNPVQEITECEQIQLQNYELKRSIIRVEYELFLARSKEVNTETTKYINSLFERYQVDSKKFELRDRRFYALPEDK